MDKFKDLIEIFKFETPDDECNVNLFDFSKDSLYIRANTTNRLLLCFSIAEKKEIKDTNIIKSIYLFLFYNFLF